MRDRAHTALPTAIPAVAQLAVRSVTRSYGTRTILDQVSFTVRPGEKAAVIGENGSGKSTLLRLLAAAETPDAGEVAVRFPGGTGHLAQTLALDADRTVAVVAVSHDRDFRARFEAERLELHAGRRRRPGPAVLTPSPRHEPVVERHP